MSVLERPLSCELCACVHMRRKGTWKHHPSPSPPTACRARSSWMWLLLQAPNDFFFFSLSVKILPELSSWVENVPFPAILQLVCKAPGGPRRTPSEPSSPYQPPLGDQAPAFVPLKTSCRDLVASKSWPGSRRDGPGVHLETWFQEPYLIFPNTNPKGYPAVQSSPSYRQTC